MHPRYPEIFSPFQIRHLELKNRIVVPPMLQLRSIASPEGIGWYRRLAAGGAGMVIVEVTSILRFGSELTPQTLRPLVETIHRGGAAAAIQLFPIQFGQQVDPNTLTAAQIDEIVELYGDAAAMCREVGFDAVEPHGAHGYLLNQFFMPDRNHRDDEYGGSLENRGRLAREIVREIRRRVGEDYLIFYRHTPVGQAYGVEESLSFAAGLVEEGVDLLDISPARRETEADLAKPFKALGVPVIAVNGMQDPQAATRALREGRCDLVAIGRSLIADAALPNKLRDGREADIIECLTCDSGCMGHIRTNEPVYCAVWQKDEVVAFIPAGA